MLERLEQFTGEDTRKVQDLINRDFADATPEEIKLYAEWKTAHALQSVEFEAEIEGMKAKIEQQASNDAKLVDLAAGALKARSEAARLRLEKLKGGK